MDAPLVPQTVLEKLWAKWDPTKFDLVPTLWPAQDIIIVQATKSFGTSIKVQELTYIYALMSLGVKTADGTLPAVGYRIGAKAQPGGEDWTNGTLAAAIVTGDRGSAISTPIAWPTVRSLISNESLAITVDNNMVGAVDLTIDVGAWGLTVRQRRPETLG